MFYIEPLVTALSVHGWEERDIHPSSVVHVGHGRENPKLPQREVWQAPEASTLMPHNMLATVIKCQTCASCPLDGVKPCQRLRRGGSCAGLGMFARTPYQDWSRQLRESQREGSR